MRRKLWRPLVVVVLALPCLFGHGGGCCEGEDEVLGPPTETVCPENSELTYESFGEAFFADYCTRCHSVDVTGGAREGAPSDHNFDTQFEAQALADHIDQAAGSGPASTNTAMPPDEPFPSMTEREQLAEWLACGAP